MIRGISWRWQTVSACYPYLTDPGKGACNQIVDKGNALGADSAGAWGQQQIIVDECWAVGYFYKDIFSKCKSVYEFCIFRRNIIVE